YNLQARQVRVGIRNDWPAAGGIDLIAFDTRAAVKGMEQANALAAAEGSYVIIARDNINTAGSVGRMNGRAYRIGARRTEFDNDQTAFPTVSSSIVYEL